MSAAHIVGELRDWTLLVDENGKHTFQGRVFNHVYHIPDGTFRTIVADEVQWFDKDCMVTDHATMYYLWGTHRRKEK